MRTCDRLAKRLSGGALRRRPLQSPFSVPA